MTELSFDPIGPGPSKAKDIDALNVAARKIGKTLAQLKLGDAQIRAGRLYLVSGETAVTIELGDRDWLHPSINRR